MEYYLNSIGKWGSLEGTTFGILEDGNGDMKINIFKSYITFLFSKLDQQQVIVLNSR